jgi:hypothetical protein
MLKSFLQPDSRSPFLFTARPPAESESADIERAFARCFASEDGRKVIAHLQVMTFQRAFGPDAPDAQLRYIEGQRALVASVLRLIDRGRHPSN